MVIEIRLSGDEEVMLRKLTAGSYRGWNERDLAQTLASIALRLSLEDHVSWEAVSGSASCDPTRPD